MAKVSTAAGTSATKIPASSAARASNGRRAGTIPPDPIGPLVVDAVAHDRRELFYPANVRALRIFHGLSPRLADTLLRRIRGTTAAPRRR